MKKLSVVWDELTKEVEESIEYKIESVSMDIAIQIYKKMNELKISQTQLADKLNVNKSYISQILKGKNNLTIESLIKISEALNMKTEIKFIPVIDNAVDVDFFRLNAELPAFKEDYFNQKYITTAIVGNNMLCSDFPWRYRNENFTTPDGTCSNIQGPCFSI